MQLEITTTSTSPGDLNIRLGHRGIPRKLSHKISFSIILISSYLTPYRYSHSTLHHPSPAPPTIVIPLHGLDKTLKRAIRDIGTTPSLCSHQILAALRDQQHPTSYLGQVLRRAYLADASAECSLARDLTGQFAVVSCERNWRI
jgi:hypothetical protein